MQKRILFFGKYFLLILLVLLLYNCKQTKKIDNKYIWHKVMVDSNVVNCEAFKKLDTQHEILYPFEKRDTFKRKSCDIVFYSANENKNNDSIKSFKCTANFYKPDTLCISVDYADGFSSRGFTVIYKNGFFFTQINNTTDMTSDQNENSVFYKTVYQKLVLNKSNYQQGDSIFGWVDFNIVEHDSDNKRAYIGKGYFKAKIGIK